MATFAFKTIEELNKLAKSYNTNVNNLLVSSLNNTSTYGDYSIDEGSVEKFNNIVKFYLNASVKDSDLLDNADNAYSSAFKTLLMKYYEKGLDNNDVYLLLKLVANYNTAVEDYMNNDVLVTCFGLKANYDTDGYFNRICTAIKSLINEAFYSGEFMYDTLDYKITDVYYKDNNNIRPYLLLDNGSIYLSNAENKKILYLTTLEKLDMTVSEFENADKLFSNGAKLYNTSSTKVFRKITIDNKEIEIRRTFIGDIGIYEDNTGATRRYGTIKNEGSGNNQSINIPLIDLTGISAADIVEPNINYIYKIEKTEFLYKKESENTYHHTGKFVKLSFSDWVNGYISSIIVGEGRSNSKYNKTEFFEKLINSSFIEFLTFFYIYNVLGAPKTNGKSYAIAPTKNSNENSSTGTTIYVNRDNIRSALYYKKNSYSGVDDYETYPFQSVYNQIVLTPTLTDIDNVKYGEIDSSIYTPSFVTSITYATPVEGPLSSGATTLYRRSASTNGTYNYTAFGHVGIEQEIYFDISTSNLESQSTNDDRLKTLYNYMSNILGWFYSGANAEGAPNIKLNRMTDISEASFLYNYILQQYIGTLSILKYKEIMLEKAKIMYNFVSNPASSGTTKLIADISEITEAQNNNLIAGFNLIDITLNETEYSIFKDELPYFKDILESTVKEITTSDTSSSNSYVFSLGVIYKELNPLYRSIEKSDILELILTLLDRGDSSEASEYAENERRNSKVFTDVETDRLITSSLDYYIRNIMVSNTTLIDTDIRSLLSSLYCNPYNARKARESDIIQYCAGSYIDYGTTSNEMKEINTFLELYQETREVYYRKLLNKSFTQDENYDAYEKFMLATIAIERFISSKIDNIHDIEYFDKTDIHNFLETYGMGILETTAAFVGKTDYQKIIIRNFNKLTRLKGSSAVIDKIIEIFSSGDTTVDINKYSLVDYTDLSSVSSIDNNERYKESYTNSKYYLIKIYDESYNDMMTITDPTNANKTIDINRFGEYGSHIQEGSERYSLITDTITDGTSYLIGLHPGCRNLLENGTHKGYIYSANGDTIPLSMFLYSIDQNGLVKLPKKYLKIAISYVEEGKTKYRYYETPKYPYENNVSFLDYVYNDSTGVLRVTYLVDNDSYELNIELGSTLNNQTVFSVSSEDRVKYVTCGICYKESLLNKTGAYYEDKEVDYSYKVPTKIGFVELNYNPENETKDIINNVSNIKSYENFVATDPYWDSEVVTEDLLRDMNLNVVTTKYSAFDLSINIFNNLIKTRYCVSLIDYLHEKLKYTTSDNNGSTGYNILENIYFGSTLINGIDTLTLSQIYTIIKLLYRIVIISKYKILHNNTSAMFPDSIYRSGDGKYYGINRNANIIALLEKLNTEHGLYIDGVQERIYAKRVKSSGSNNKAYEFVTDPETGKISSVKIFNPYINSDQTVSTVYSLDSNLYSNYGFSNKIGYSIDGQKFLSQFKEIKVPTSVTKGLDSSSEVEDYLMGANYISLLNDENDYGAAWSLYLAEIPASDQDNKLTGLTLTNLDKSMSSIYELMIKKILQLPMDYLSGIKNPSYGNYMYLNDTFNLLIDNLYTDFYLSDVNSLPLDLSLSDDELILLNNNTAIKDYILNDMYSIVEDSETHKMVLSPNSTELNEDHLAEVTDRLINWMEDITSILESEEFMQILFQLDSNINGLATFIIAAIKLFISYTSEICEVRTTQKYESEGEYASPYDYIHMESSVYLNDLSYYDEKIQILKLPDDEEVDE